MNTNYHSFTTRFNTAYRNAALFGAFALLLNPLSGWAQAGAAAQTFEISPSPVNEIAFTPTDGGYFTPAGATGLGAYGVANSTPTPALTTLEFIERTFAVNSGTTTTPNQLSLDLANPIGQFGADSKIEVFLDINRDGFPLLPQLTITAASSTTYGFGTGDTKTVASNATNAAVVGLAPDLNPISKVIITLPSSTTTGTRVALKIRLTAENGATLLTDNVIFAAGDGSPLPVELTRFNATAQGQSVNVSWATAMEKNNARFEVQRSATGEVFETVGTVKGKGNTSSAHNYAFVDSRPLAGRSYYRLRQVDTDGTTAYSPVAAVQVRNELAVYPNPSTGIVTLPATLGDVRYRLLNTIGQTLLSGQATGNDQLDLTKLAKGTFFLELTGEAGRTTQRLVRE